MTDKTLADISFTSAQLALLEQAFPSVSYNYDATEAKLRHYHGQQSVLDFIRRKTRGVDPNRQHIPAPR